MRTFSRSVALALLAPAAAWAQVDTSDWICEYCPFEEGYRADYEAGGSYVNEDASRFGNATGYDEKGGYVNLDGEGSYAKDGRQMRWYAEDLGLSSRVLHIEGGRQGTFGLDLTYSELPYRLFDTSRTVFTNDGDNLNLPSGWVRAPTTGGMTQLGSSLNGRPIETDRQILEVGGNYMPTNAFTVFADYRRQQRDGVAIDSGSTFTQGVYLPRPIDDYTDEMNVGAGYESGAFNVQLAWYASFYRNDVGSLTWDNPFTGFAGADQGRTAVAPDNDFTQISLSGGYFAEMLDTTIVFSAAVGQGEQTATLLPYTINPLLSPPSLPVTALDGKVDTSNYAFTVTSRPFDKARVKLSYRFDERDNKTPISTWERVITDALTSGDPETNVPYSFERSRLNLSASYRLFDSLLLSAGYDRGETDRDMQEVAEQTEETGWGKLRWRPNGYVDIAIRGGTSRRDIDRYYEAFAATLGQNPLMRKYNLAYRYREFGEVTVSGSLPNAPVSAGITWLMADDSYSQSELGMTDSTEDRYTIDLSWAVSETSSIYVSAGSELLKAGQLGSETFSAPNWNADHEDDFTHYGAGFRILDIGDKGSVEVDYTRSTGETDIAVTRFGETPSILPTLESVMDMFRLNVAYAFSDRLDATLMIAYEHADFDDWALDGVGPATIPSVLTMGASAFDYDVWLAGIGFRYRIGGGNE